MISRFAHLLALFLLVVSFSEAQQQDHQQQSASRTSQVTLSLDEFQEIFAAARIEDAERRLRDKQKRNDAEHERVMDELRASMKPDNDKLHEQARKRRDELFQHRNFLSLRHAAAGSFNATDPAAAGAERDVASFDVELICRVLEPQWTVIPLVNTSSTVASQWRVQWRPDDAPSSLFPPDSQKDNGNGDDPPGDAGFQDVDHVLHPDVMLMLQEEDGQYVLATNRSGLFRVQFVAHTRVRKQRNLNALGLSSLLYPLQDFALRIASHSSQAGFVKDLSVEPAETVLRVTSNPQEGYTEVRGTLPLSADSIEIKWVPSKQEVTDTFEGDATMEDLHAEEKGQDDDASATQVSAYLESLHSVDEGILRSTHTLELSTTSETSSLKDVRFVVHGHGARVTSVVGHALESWSTQRISTSSKDNSDGATAAEGSSSFSTLVIASFRRSHISSSSTLKVYTELDRDNASQQVTLPRIACMNVIRQTGQVAIVKDANVEVHEHKIAGLSRCDASDLSSQLRLNTNHRPIVLSYKYLTPDYSAQMDVMEHAAMDTLEATIDRVHYKAVITDTHIVHSAILIVQSTKLQYLELSQLLPTASHFQVAVNSVPAKPVGKAGDASASGDSSERASSILIPLLVGLNPESANEGHSLKSSIEVTYFSRHQETLGHNGTLVLTPPGFTLPVSVFTVHLRLPKQYRYAFSGSFGNNTSSRLEYPIPSAFSYKTGKRVVQKGYKFSRLDDVWPDEDNDGSNSNEESGATKSGDSGGGVKIVTPNTGRSFYFDKLLVLDGELALNATYCTPTQEAAKRPWWKVW